MVSRIYGYPNIFRQTERQINEAEIKGLFQMSNSSVKTQISLQMMMCSGIMRMRSAGSLL